jgi:hypothetical protein
MTGAPRRWLIVFAAVAGLAAAREASAFRLAVWDSSIGMRPNSIPLQPYPILHWDLREFPDCRIPIAITRLTQDLTPSEQSGQILNAMRAWEDIEPARIGFVLTGHGLATPPGHARDGYNTIAFVDTAMYEDVRNWMGEKSPLAALTYVYSDTLTGRILEADIRLNNKNIIWGMGTHDQEVINPFLTDLRTVVQHEFGHFIGLGHPRDDLDDWDFDTFPYNDFPSWGDLDRDSDGVLDMPLMRAKPGPMVRWHFSWDDHDGCNFLYNPDLGDAPDPFIAYFNEFPSRVHQSFIQTGVLNERPRYAPAEGASHFFSIRTRQPSRNYSYEWLGLPFRPQAGDNFDGECDSRQVDRDVFDDGVTMAPNPAVYRKPVAIDVWVRYATDATGRAHDYSARSLHENTWLDFDLDGDWVESERFLREALRPSPDTVANQAYWARVDTTLVLPDLLVGSTKPMWLRARVDWGEDGGDAGKVEPGLVGPRGAAQFGEVEDHPITMLKPKVQLVVPNASGGAAQGIELTVPAQPGAGQNYQSHTTPGDCPTAPFPSPTSQSYDGLADETTMTYSSGIVLPGGTVHVGRAQPDTPAQAVRARWIPALGPPGQDDWIPTVNATALDLHAAGAGDRRTRVVVGAVDTAAGGVIAGDPGTFTWQDSMYVDVIARLAPGSIPLENLSLCHPDVTGLAPIPLGGRWITPQDPFTAELPEAMVEGALVLEVHCAWSVNTATSTQLIEFSEVLSPVTAAPAGAVSRSRFGLRAVPTPARGPAAIEFTLAHAARVTLGLYDLAGRRRRVLRHDRPFAAGTTRLDWDGRAEDGRRLAAGIYFVRLEVDGERETARLIVLEP